MKTKLLKKLSLAVACFAMTSVSAQLTTFSTDLDGWAQNWGAAAQVVYNASEGITGDGALELVRTSNNSGFGLVSSPGIDAGTMKFVKLVYKNTSNATSIRFQGTSSAGAIAQTAFSIGSNSDEYITSYFDLSAVTNWSGNVTDLDVLVRSGWVSGEGSFYLDEIEFLAAMPATTYNEFIQNPGFDGPTGIGHLTGSKSFVTRGITTTESKDGTQSLRNTFTADADATFWTFSSYEKTYGSVYPIDHAIQIKMWVKTNRATTISMSGRVKTTIGGADTATKPITTVSTTNTAMEWEEITFDLTNAEAFDGIFFWFSINWADGGANNLMSGDIVYIDQISATISAAPVASVAKNTLQGVEVYPNPTTDVVNVTSPVGSEISITNLTGAVVKTVNANANNTAIQVSDLTSGIYVLRVLSEGKNFVTKVVIE